MRGQLVSVIESNTNVKNTSDGMHAKFKALVTTLSVLGWPSAMIMKS